jgi:hypothetical protein
LSRILSRGIYVDFYDPDGTRYGLPTYPYRWAPKNLLTVRQLRAIGLRVAYLYDTALALPKRQATSAQLTALAAAMRARRTCPACRQEKTYCIPRSTGCCNDCDRRSTS